MRPPRYLLSIGVPLRPSEEVSFTVTGAGVLVLTEGLIHPASLSQFRENTSVNCALQRKGRDERFHSRGGRFPPAGPTCAPALAGGRLDSEVRPPGTTSG